MTQERNAEAIPLRDAGFRDAVIPFFHERGIQTLGDLAKYTAGELWKKGIVKRRLGFVREKLAHHGLHLKHEGGARAQPRSPNLTSSHAADAAKIQRGGGLEDQHTTPESNDEVFPLAYLMPDGTTDINAFTKQNQRLVYAYVRRSSYKYLLTDDVDAALEIEDMDQEAFLGFLKAISKYDPTLGYAFSTYAWRWFRHKLSRLIQNSGTIRIPVHMWDHIGKYLKTERAIKQHTGYWPMAEEVQDALGLPNETFEGVKAAMFHYRNRVISIHKTIGGDNDRTYEENIAATNNGSDHQATNGGGTEIDSVAQDIEDAITTRITIQQVLANASLLEVEQQILIRRFGLDGDMPQTHEEIGQAIGVTRERIRQREVQALKKLRDPRLWEIQAEDAEDSSDQETADNEFTRLTMPHRMRKEHVLEVFCEYYESTSEELFGKSRVKPLATLRQILMYLLRECAKLSYPEIGKFLGNRDHTTIMHGYWVVQKLLETDPTKRYEVSELMQRLNTESKQEKSTENKEERPKEARAFIQEDERVDPEFVLDVVCEYYGSDRMELLGSSKYEHNVIPRKVLIYLLYTYTRQKIDETATYTRIVRDVVYKISTWVENEMERNEELKEDVNELRWMLGAKLLQQLEKKMVVP